MRTTRSSSRLAKTKDSVTEPDDSVSLSLLSKKTIPNKTKEKCKPYRTKVTCPNCKKQFNHFGYKYHTKNKVCHKPTPEKRQSAGGRIYPQIEDNSRPFCQLPSYNEDTNMEFITKFGIVRIVKDDRMGDDFGRTVVDVSLMKSEYLKRHLWKIRYNAKKDARRLREYSSWLERRKWVDRLYQNFIYPDSIMSHDVTDCNIVIQEKKEVELVCPLPGIIAGEQLSLCNNKPFMNRSFQQPIPSLQDELIDFPPNIFQNVLHPKDSYPQRIIECILINDKRDRVVLGQNHPEETITQSSNPSNLQYCKLYLQRQEIQKMYLEHQKKYNCYDCGAVYSFRNTLGLHMKNESCLKKKKQKRYCDIINDVRNYEPVVKSKKLREIRDRRLADRAATANKASADHYVVSTAQQELQLDTVNEPSLDQSNVVPKTQLEPKPVPRTVNKSKPKSINNEPKKKRCREKELQFPPLNSMYQPLFSYLGYKRKKFGVYLKIRYPISMYTQVTDFLQFRKEKKKRKRKREYSKEVLQEPNNAKFKRRKEDRFLEKQAPRGRNLTPRDSDTKLVDIRALVHEIEAGRYSSIKPYTQQHLNKQCYICKQNSKALHPCKYCFRCSHVDCVYSKRPFIGFDDPVYDTFMCHVCILYVMDRRKTSHKRKLERIEEAKEKHARQLDDDYVADVENESKRVNNCNVNAVLNHGKEVKELVQLTAYTRLKLKRSIYLSKSNDIRRSMLS